MGYQKLDKKLKLDKKTKNSAKTKNLADPDRPQIFIKTI